MQMMGVILKLLSNKASFIEKINLLHVCLPGKQQEVEKSMEKSKQPLLNLYGQTDNNRELNVKSVEEELDYIRHLQDKAARARCAAKR
jgi:hypothetical protein